MAFYFQVALQVWCVRLHSCYTCVVVGQCVWLFVPHGLGPARLLCPWSSPGKETGVGCHAHSYEFCLSLTPTLPLRSVTFPTPLDDVLGVRPCLAAVLSSVPMTGGVDVFACYCIMFSFMSYVCGFFAVSFWKLQGFFTNTEHVSPTRSHAGCEPRRKASSSKQSCSLPQADLLSCSPASPRA